MWVRLFAVIGLFLSFLAGAMQSAYAGRVQYSGSGVWSVYAYFDKNKDFRFCAIKTQNKNSGDIVTLIVRSDGYSLYLDNRDWSLDKGDFYESSFRIGQQSWSGKAKVYSRDGVSVEFPFDTEFGVYYQRGPALDVTIGRLNRSISLEGAREAIPFLSRCLDDNIPRSNPF